MSEAFRAVAIDYDGTLTGPADRPAEDALDAIDAARRAGMRLILVTGRILDELRSVFPTADHWFDAIVAENGAVLSVEGATRILAAPVEFELDEALVGRGVPFRRGQVLIATVGAREAAVTDEIRRLGLECQLVRNRGELMVLPPGISKGFGVAEALADLGLSHHSAIAVGDGENDHALLRSCELGVAVANAVPGLKRHADVVTRAAGGAGVAELLRGPIVRGDTSVDATRWRVEVGRDADGERVMLPGGRINLLVAGRSKSGKSFFAGMLAERLIGLGYSLCIIDPHGDYVGLAALRSVVNLAGPDGQPVPSMVARLVEHRFGSVLVDLSAVHGAERAAHLDELMRQLDAERRTTGLPHWVVWDEAHAAVDERHALMDLLQSPLKGCCLVTYRPHELPEAAQKAIDWVVALPGGKEPTADEGPDPLDALAELHGVDFGTELGDHEAVLYRPDDPRSARRFRMLERRSPHVRHWRRYRIARLPEPLHFLFRDEQGALRGACANVEELHQMLRTCDVGVLRHHVVRHDLSRWMAQAIQDADLARDLRALEDEFAASARDERQLARFREAVARAIERRYLD